MNGTDAFTFFGIAFEKCSEDNTRDIFTIEIPFQRDVLAEDFVTTTNTIRIEGRLTNASGAINTTAYNSNDGGGCLGQLIRLRSLAIPDGDAPQDGFLLASTDAASGVYADVNVFIKGFNYSFSSDAPVSVITYSIELMRMTPL